MIYFTPGPSQLHKNIARYIQDTLKYNVGSVSHRSEIYKKWHSKAVLGIRKFLSVPDSHSVFFLSSSLESMERIIQNTVYKSSFHVIIGAFSKKWYEIAEALKKSPTQITIPDGQPIPEKITLPQNTEVVCITQNETSTGVSIPLNVIHSFKKKYPHVLVAVDVVSSCPFPKLDYSRVDFSFFSVQKGLGLPAGLGVLTVSPQALFKSQELEKKYSVGSYHSFSSLKIMADKSQTPETPNVLGIYLLGKILHDLNKKGIKKIRYEINEKAKLIHNFFSKNPQMGTPFVSDSRFRSSTTLMFKVGTKQKKILNALKKEGVIIGRGYGAKYKNGYIRVANFPQHSLQMVNKLLKVLDKIK